MPQGRGASVPADGAEAIERPWIGQVLTVDPVGGEEPFPQRPADAAGRGRVGVGGKTGVGLLGEEGQLVGLTGGEEGADLVD